MCMEKVFVSTYLYNIIIIINSICVAPLSPKMQRHSVPLG